MTTTTNKVILTSHMDALIALRALAATPAESYPDARHVADKQARHLRDRLPARAGQIPERLTDLIPSLLIEYVDDIPVRGISFWANGRWHVHVRVGESPGNQAFTVLHALKHIIDHPQRQQTAVLSNGQWEALANRFAIQVLTGQPSHTVAPRKEEAYG